MTGDACFMKRKSVRGSGRLPVNTALAVLGLDVVVKGRGFRKKAIVS